MHPSTCGNDSRHPVLVADALGWTCTACDYTQDWARQTSENRQRISADEPTKEAGK